MFRGERHVIVSAVLSVAALILATLTVILSRNGGAVSGAAGHVPLTPATRIDRDAFGLCIPERPAVQEQCDPFRQLFWDNRNGELGDLVRRLGVQITGPADLLAAHMQFRADAGDLGALRHLAHQSGRADVRVVAIGLMPDDATQEYAEIRNIGAAGARLERYQLHTPGGIHTFRFAPVFRFPGVLAPGEICRVYTQRAGQPDACAGEWSTPPRAGVWPVSGAWVILRAGPSRPVPGQVDRWWYGPQFDE